MFIWVLGASWHGYGAGLQKWGRLLLRSAECDGRVPLSGHRVISYLNLCNSIVLVFCYVQLKRAAVNMQLQQAFITGFCQRMASTSCIFIDVVLTWKLDSLACAQTPVVHRHTVLLWRTWTQWREVHEPHLHCISPYILASWAAECGWWRWVAKGRVMRCGRAPCGSRGEGGRRRAGCPVCLGRDGEILNPSAFCCPSSRLWSFWSSAVWTSSRNQPVVYFYFYFSPLRIQIFDYIRVSWSQISTQGERLTLSQLVVIPQRGTDGGKLGVAKPQECWWQPLCSWQKQ